MTHPDDEMSEHGTAGDPDRVALRGQPLSNAALRLLGYRLELPGEDSLYVVPCMLAPDGRAFFAETEDALWAVARQHQRRSHITLDPRDPDPSKSGIFRDHNCWRCGDGAKPCVRGTPSRCEYPHARND